LSQVSGNARDLVALRTSLQQMPELKRELQKLLDRLAFGANHANGNGHAPSLAQVVQDELHEMPELVANLARAVVEDPPFVLKEGGIFLDGFNSALDELRRASREGKTWIGELQEREIAADRNQVAEGADSTPSFGYFIEITKSNSRGVPAHYTRKQRRSAASAFITPELKGDRGADPGADERSRPA
jgi:DNA mismatch repair protein MutS